MKKITVFTCICLGIGLMLFHGDARAAAYITLPLDQSPDETQQKLLNHGVQLEGSPAAARFNGRDSWLEIQEPPAPGTQDFSLAMWIHTDAVLSDGLGDLASNFDTKERKGFTLGLACYGGVGNSQPNDRNLFFGVDNQTEPQWEFCGRPGNAILIFGFAVYEGKLFAATCEAGEEESGHVYRYGGGQEWIDCGSPDTSNAVKALAVFDGQLYAGTGRYDTTGSALEASQNTTAGGKVYRYEEDGSWTYCGLLENPQTGTASTLGGLGGYKGALYATTLKEDGFGLYRYEGGTDWFYCGNPERRVLNPSMFNGDLYMVSYDSPGGPFRYNGSKWAYVGATIDPPIHQDYGFAVYGGQLHVSTWPQAYIYRMDNTSGAWSARGNPKDELETMALMVYNGKLYTGTLPSSRVYRLDDDATWTAVSEQLDTAPGKYRRTWSMALYQGKLFCGTLPTGNVMSMETGCSLSYDHALSPGWHHIAALRDGKTVRLYVDGVQVVSKTGDALLDVSTDEALSIGKGPGDYFNGSMRDFRLYQKALSPAQIQELYEQGSALLAATP